MECGQKSCASCTEAGGKKKAKEEVMACRLSRIKNKLVVMSGKGGVGKSSVACYLALSLAERGFKVGLLDVDLHGPSIPKMFGLNGPLNITSEREIVPYPYSPNLKIVSIESMLEDTDSPIIWRGPIKHGVIQQFLADCDWGDLDFLVIDSPPGTGDEPLSVSRLIPEAMAIIVTTPQEVALADVRKSITFCRKVNMQILGLVENMSGMFCPHCNEFIPIFRTGGGLRTSDAMKIDFLGELPFEPKVVEGGDRGKPILNDGEKTPFAKSIGEFTEAVLARLGTAAAKA
ncbi:MAG: Mrp/NBP35 family ATP-binding protein [Desulfobacteraceae bacterium]|nr:Mrp/NBP35 family ATP-binding protein [Desulfobacteraceae bacterium]